mmetsp:Transcript_14890/g.35246  ORF Transcript_14890/g.35246 Transcript_14890/m.35246 type:complete len:91 (+) Transcript_14890:206-478(+)
MESTCQQHGACLEKELLPKPVGLKVLPRIPATKAPRDFSCLALASLEVLLPNNSEPGTQDLKQQRLSPPQLKRFAGLTPQRPAALETQTL